MQPAPPPPPSAKPAPPPAAKPRRSALRRFALMFGLLVAAFAIGFIPPTLEARRAAAELRTTQLDLRLATLHRQLGVASHEAQRNNYASAMSAARQFFDGCRDLAQSETFENEPRTRIAISTYAASADQVLTQLATANPAAKERLLTLYLTMDGVLQRRGQ
jgi:hypothetical protein